MCVYGIQSFIVRVCPPTTVKFYHYHLIPQRPGRRLSSARALILYVCGCMCLCTFYVYVLIVVCRFCCCSVICHFASTLFYYQQNTLLDSRECLCVCMCVVPIIVLFDKCKANLYTDTRALVDRRLERPHATQSFYISSRVCRSVSHMCECVRACVFG